MEHYCISLLGLNRRLLEDVYSQRGTVAGMIFLHDLGGERVMPGFLTQANHHSLFSRYQAETNRKTDVRQTLATNGVQWLGDDCAIMRDPHWKVTARCS